MKSQFVGLMLLVVGTTLMLLTIRGVAQEKPLDQLDRLVEKEFGEVLFTVPEQKLSITVKRSDKGKPESIAVIKHESGAIFEYVFKGPFQVPMATYTDARALADTSHIRWFDWNGDGVFDQRVIVGENKPLRVGTGAEIFVDGSWKRGSRAGSSAISPFLVDNVEYRFNSSSGTWEPGSR